MKTDTTLEEKMFEIFKKASEQTRGLVEIAGQNYINENIVKQALKDHEEEILSRVIAKAEIWKEKGFEIETLIDAIKIIPIEDELDNKE